MFVKTNRQRNGTLFPVVDNAVLEQYSRPSGMPLLLAALEYRPANRHFDREQSSWNFVFCPFLWVGPNSPGSIRTARRQARQRKQGSRSASPTWPHSVSELAHDVAS